MDNAQLGRDRIEGIKRSDCGCRAALNAQEEAGRILATVVDYPRLLHELKCNLRLRPVLPDFKNRVV
jgi:hypothetical protein